MTDELDLDQLLTRLQGEDFAMLAGVSAAARRELLSSSKRRSLVAGEVLIREGEPAGAMYFVVVGELGVALGDVNAPPIALIGPGETVGELGVIDGSVASAFVVARTPCDLLSLDEAAFWALTHHSHAFSINLLVKLAERLRANNARLKAAEQAKAKP